MEKVCCDIAANRYAQHGSMSENKAFFSMMEDSLKQVNPASRICDVPEEYRKTPDEAYASRRRFERRIAENGAIRHESLIRAANTPTQC